MSKRLLSFALAVLMLFTIFPVNGFAAEAEDSVTTALQADDSETILLKYGEKTKIDSGVKFKKVSSENSKVATVTTAGQITAKGAGKTNVHLMDINGREYTIFVKVVGVLSASSLTLAPGKTVAVTLKGAMLNSGEANNGTVVSATVAKNKGTLKALEAGITTVHFYDTLGNDYPCTVNVEAPVISNPEKVLTVGQSLQIGLTGNTQKITWSASPSSVASVSKTGLLQAKKAGTVVVTAKAATGYKTTKTLTVQPTLKQADMYAAVGDSAKLTVVGGTRIVSISSSDESIAIPTKAGVKAVGKGSTTITVKDNKGNLMTCSFTGEDPVLSEDSQNLVLGQGRSTVLSVEGTNQLVKWSSSGAASITKAGILTATRVGTAKITATVASGRKLTTTVQVIPMISSTEMVLALGDRGSLKLNGTKLLSIDNSAPDVATIDNKGNIKTLSTGFTTLTMWGQDGNGYECALTVEDPTLEAENTVYLNGTSKLEIQGNSQAVKWSISGNAAKINAVGVVSGVKLGTAKVTAKLASGRTLVTQVQVVEAPKFRVSFETNGAAPIKDVLVTDGTTVSAPADPARENYIFTGWYKTDDLTSKYDFTKRVRGDMTLYAGWLEKTPDANVVTRGQWAYGLVDALGIDKSIDFSDISCYYGDTSYSPYGIAIETLQAYGFLPPVILEDVEQDIPMFRPDAPATREFVAYTAAHALGMELNGIKTPKWSDVKSIQYVAEAVCVVQNNILQLVGKAFMPGAALTEDECAFALKAIGDMANDIVIDEEYNNVTLTANTLELDSASYTVRDNGDNTYTILLAKQPDAMQIKNGSIILLPDNDTDAPSNVYKVKSVKVLSDFVMVVGSIPKVEEVFTSIDMQARAEAVLSQVSAAQGVYYAYSAGGLSETENEPILDGNFTQNREDLPAMNAGLPGKFTLDLHEASVGGATLSGTIEIEVPDIVWIANIDYLHRRVDEFTVGLTESIKFNESLTYEFASSGGDVAHGRHEFFRIPFKVPGHPEFSIDVVFYCRYTAEGTVAVEYEIISTQGYSYKNGSGRWIFDLSHNMTYLQAQGSAEFAVGVGLDIVLCKVWDLFGLSIEGGPAVALSPVTIRNDFDGLGNTLYCADASLYATLKAGLDPDTLLVDMLKNYLHLTVEYTFLDNDSSNPFRMNGHLENAQLVDECTFGKGGFKGRVVDAQTQQPIANARMQVYDQFGRETLSISTGPNGEYMADRLNTGEYTVSISANGYKRYDMNVEVQTGHIAQMPDAQMISRNVGDGHLLVNVEDAATAELLSGFDYEVRKGWDATTGGAVAQGHSDGYGFTLELPIGNYTVLVKREEYADAAQNVTVVEYEEGTPEPAPYMVSMTKLRQVGEEWMQVVLKWGDNPRDLDSHMVGPNGSGKFHTYFSDQDAYDENGEQIANLDRDDVSGNGTETTTVYRIDRNGLYSFYVHDYTNRYENDSSRMSYSGATVEVRLGSGVARTFHIPVDVVGTVWHVFDYDPATGRVIAKDIFSNVSSPSSVGNSTRYDTNWEILETDLLSSFEAKPEGDALQETIDEETPQEEIPEEKISEEKISEEEVPEEVLEEEVLEEMVLTEDGTELTPTREKVDPAA